MDMYEFSNGDIAKFDIEGMTQTQLGVFNMLVINAEVAFDEAAAMGGSEENVKRWKRKANECGVLRNRIESQRVCDSQKLKVVPEVWR